ncbi:MAG: glycosyltransferase family 4 protein [Candidatus Omnitrophota bacterium]
MPKINLLYIVTKLELGGAQKQLLSLIEGLDKKKYNIFLFTAKDGLLIDAALSICNLNVHRSTFLERSINPIKDLLALIEISGFIKKNKIQIVHTHSSKAGILGRFAARLAKTPVIIHTVHGWSFHDYQPALASYFYLILEKISACFTSKIIVVSNFDRIKGLKNSIGQEKSYTLIRYGIDASRFKSREKLGNFKKSLGIKDSDLAVGMIACFKPQKSPLDFIKLAKAIKVNFSNVKFILVGDGQLRVKICALIKEFDLENQVILTGWRNDVPQILSSLDVFVLTSRWEGLPIVILEAMAVGVPFVATDTGGIKEIAENLKSGYLVMCADLLSMQAKLEELLSNPQRRREFVTASEAIINSGEFDLSKMVMDTERLYSDLLNAWQKA